MKKLLISTSLVIAMGLPAVAAETSSMFRTEAGPSEFQASSFVGERIYQTETDGLTDVMDGVQDGWKDIGEVNDIILSRDGSVEAVLVDIGGFLGIGENQVAVDMDALTFVRDGSTAEGAEDYFLVLNAPVAALESAPSYGMSAQIDAEADLSGDAALDGDATIDQQATADTSADQIVDGVVGTHDTADLGASAGTAGEFTAEELTGATAFDANEEMVGEVSDIVVDGEGSVDAVIVDVGGFLGLGAKPVELGLDDLTIEDQDGTIRIYTMLTKQQMEELPEYQG